MKGLKERRSEEEWGKRTSTHSLSPPPPPSTPNTPRDTLSVPSVNHRTRRILSPSAGGGGGNRETVGGIKLYYYYVSRNIKRKIPATSSSCSTSSSSTSSSYYSSSSSSTCGRPSGDALRLRLISGCISSRDQGVSFAAPSHAR
ncbi:hypothetical protein E2C01_052723 [Portunus trituberculatus]|uniref:Uncharacterized protein n=1 Tax=Portunus trituberculatus TaxID=210409 RepID=A0A5B7GMM1_PORTR|nr:hypothetical protein [Portunus trituberculatus]